MTDKLWVNVSQPYPIYFGANLFDHTCFIEQMTQKNSNYLWIIDENVYHHYSNIIKDFFTCHRVEGEYWVIPSGERVKTREMKSDLEDRMIAKGYGREVTLLALGGGVVSDLVGFLASTYCRGVPVIYYPTTLLAMADASIGGKTAVNTPYAKNSIGSFYQPASVWIDVSMLDTLSDALYYDGVSEIIKHALVYSESLFNLLMNHFKAFRQRDKTFLSHLLYESCQIKKKIVECDEREKGLRSILNFGHTYAHALEYVSQYQITHGSAVAAGLLFESRLSHHLGYLKKKDLSRIEALLHDYQLVNNEWNFPTQELLACMRHDKKSQKNQIGFILLEEIGQVKKWNDSYIFNIHENELFQEKEQSK